MKAEGTGSREGLNKNISIALCTYNGAAYLAEQLASLAQQSHKPFEVVVCDDCSVDDTVKIVNDFKNRVGFIVRIYENTEKLGVVKNFARAISLCRGDYIAIADQDDYWVPDKIELKLKAMKKAEERYGSTTPILIHSDLKVVDGSGDLIAKSYRRRYQLQFLQKEPLRNLLVQNYVTGCTTLVNQALVEKALPIPKQALMHDWWLAQIAAASGKIVSLDKTLVIYRQHDINVVGSRDYYSLPNVRRLSAVDSIEMTIAGSVRQSLTLIARLEDMAGFKAPSYAVNFLDAAQKSGCKAAFLALRHRIRKYPFAGNIVFLLLLLKSGYIKFLSDSLAIEQQNSSTGEL